MAMKMEDEVKHMAEILDIKIEVSNEDAKEEVKETMEIAEKIKKVIEESFGKESSGHMDNNVTDNESSLVQETTVKIEENNGSSGIEYAEIVAADNDATPVDKVIKVDYSSMSNEDYDDIAEPDSDNDSLELEELADDSTNKPEDQKETNEKLKLFAKEMKKIKNLPVPGSRKSNFKRDIRNAFEKLLPDKVLDKLTPNRCGLCHEDFTSEHYAWKHYTGYNHKRTTKYFINGTYKDHPSFYNMVLDAIHFYHPEAVSEKQIFEFIKKEHPVGDNDTRTMNLVRQRGLGRLLQIEYIDDKDGMFTATQALINRKKRSKQLLERTEPEPVKLESVVKLVKKDNIKMSKEDYQQFKDQIFDFSKKDLPKSVIDTLTPENCGLCHLEIYCKPWSHYTGTGHRTTVEIYQSGTYLGHPPYHTMIEKYIKEVQPASLKESDIINFLKKNFNLGEDMEKVKARVEKCVSLLKKKESPRSKIKFPSDSLVWFKKDASCETVRKRNDNDQKTPTEDKKEEKDDKKRDTGGRGKDDGRSMDKESRRLVSSNSKDLRSGPRHSSPRKRQLPLKRKSSPTDPGREYDGPRCSGRSMKADHNGGHLSGHSGRLDDKYRNDRRNSDGDREKKRSLHKSPDRHRRLTEKLARSPDRKRPHEKLRRSPCRRRSSEKQERSSDGGNRRSMRRKERSSDKGQRRSPRRKERSPEKCNTSSRSYQDKSGDHKRYRRCSGKKVEAYEESSVSYQREYSIKKESLGISRSSNLAPRSRHESDPRSKPRTSSRSSYDTPGPGQDKAPTNSSSHFRPGSRESLANLTNPSPPPGSFPPDFMVAAPNPAIPTPVSQAQMPFPASYLTQHPQFPHVFILNTMGGQMGAQMGGQIGGQMMMSVPMGQHPQPNQPPAL